MKILLANLTYLPTIGGVENSIYYMAKELLREGHSLTILFSNTSDTLLNNKVIKNENFINFKRNKYKVFKIFEGIIDVLSSGLAFILSREDYDLIIVRNFRVGLGLYLFSKKTKIIYVAPSTTKGIDSIDYITNAKKFKKIFYKLIYAIDVKIEKLLLLKCSHIVVFSNNMKNQILDIIGNVKKNKISRIKPGVDFTKFQKKLPIDSKNEFKTIFLIIGRCVKQKNINIVIEAFKLLNNKKIELWIVGDGAEKSNLKALVLENELGNIVKFYDSTSTPEYYYNSADAFIMSSTYESFGQTIIEAMAAGLPIIAFDSNQINTPVKTATSEIVSNYENGILCDYGINQLAKAIISFLQFDNNQINKIKERNSAKVIYDFSWRKFCKKLLTI